MPFERRLRSRFQKISQIKVPRVVLHRLNPLLENIRGNCNENGGIEARSADEVQGLVPENLLVETTVDAVNINSNNAVTEDNAQENVDNSLLIVSKIRKYVTPNLNKNIVRPTRTTKRNKIKRKQNKNQKCKKCRKTFKHINALKAHDRLKHSKVVYECEYCSKTYVRRGYFQRHTQLHCRICFKLQRNQDQLSEHSLICIQNTDLEEQNYLCDICTKKFESKCAVSYHKAFTHSSNPPTINEMYSIRTDGGNKLYYCNFCLKCSDDENDIELHARNLRNLARTEIIYDTNLSTDYFVREDCVLEPTLSLDSNIEPINNVETNEEVINTTINTEEVNAENGSDTDNEINEEKPSEMDNVIIDLENPRHQCKMCDKYFFRNADLLQHMKIHNILQHVSTELCNQVFATKSPTIQHLKLEVNEQVTPKAETVCVCTNVDCELNHDINHQEGNNSTTGLKKVFTVVIREVPVEF